jgi:nucleoside-diphosphate-sugar epimerase
MVKKVLMTGGAGFIGKYISKELINKGYKVTVLDYKIAEKVPKVEYIEDDIFNLKNGEAIAKGKDILIHLIGQPDIGIAQKDPKGSFKLNVEALQIVLDLCRVGGIPKIIFPSTAAVYGNVSLPSIDERVQVSPTCVYAWHKLVCEHMIMAYHQSYNIKYVILRLFNVLGIGNKGVIPYFLKCARETKLIKGFGGQQLRDFIPSEEVARAFYMSTIVEDVENKIINIGSGFSIKIRDLAGLVAELYPGTKIIFEEKEGFIPYHLVADVMFARKALGFDPKVTLDTLRKIIKEIDEHERK